MDTADGRTHLVHLPPTVAQLFRKERAELDSPAGRRRVRRPFCLRYVDGRASITAGQPTLTWLRQHNPFY